MIIIGLAVLLIGYFFAIHILFVIGVIVLILGLAALCLGFAGRPIGGRRYWY